jgi:hypothetical protein
MLVVLIDANYATASLAITKNAKPSSALRPSSFK